MIAEQAVDPSVSRGKFEREVAAFRSLGALYRRRGIWLLESAFPLALVGFLAVKVNPPALVFIARIDFTNYDLWAPSVTIVHPLTGEPFRENELPTRLPKRIPLRANVGGTLTEIAGQFQGQHLLQAHNPTHIPFLCLPGIREYHDHPAHTGDSWLLHRGRGEGTLAFVVEQLSKYGTDPFRSYAANLQIQITGLQNPPFDAVPL